MLAAWDMLGDMSVEHNIHVGYSISPTVRRGVFKLRLAAYRGANGAKMIKVESYEHEFPTAQVETLGGALFQCAVKLDHALAASAMANREAGAPE